MDFQMEWVLKVLRARPVFPLKSTAEIAGVINLNLHHFEPKAQWYTVVDDKIYPSFDKMI